MSDTPKWYAVQSDLASDLDNDSWTITLSPKSAGWNTDAGHCGYGLPKEVADHIVGILNRPENFTGDIFSKWKVDDTFEGFERL